HTSLQNPLRTKRPIYCDGHRLVAKAVATGCQTVANIAWQPTWQPVWQPTWQPKTRFALLRGEMRPLSLNQLGPSPEERGRPRRRSTNLRARARSATLKKEKKGGAPAAGGEAHESG